MYFLQNQQNTCLSWTIPSAQNQNTSNFRQQLQDMLFIKHRSTSLSSTIPPNTTKTHQKLVFFKVHILNTPYISIFFKNQANTNLSSIISNFLSQQTKYLLQLHILWIFFTIGKEIADSFNIGDLESYSARFQLKNHSLTRFFTRTPAYLNLWINSP